MCLRVSYRKKNMKGHWRKESDPELYPDPLVRGLDTRIRIRTKMSRIPNTGLFSTSHFPIQQVLYGKHKPCYFFLQPGREEKVDCWADPAALPRHARDLLRQCRTRSQAGQTSLPAQSSGSGLVLPGFGSVDLFSKSLIWFWSHLQNYQFWYDTLYVLLTLEERLVLILCIVSYWYVVLLCGASKTETTWIWGEILKPFGSKMHLISFSLALECSDHFHSFTTHC